SGRYSRRTVQGSHQEFAHAARNLFYRQAAVLPKPFRDPVYRSQDCESCQLAVFAMEFARRHSLFDDLAYAALEFVAPGHVSRALIGLKVFQISQQHAAQTIFQDSMDM